MLIVGAKNARVCGGDDAVINFKEKDRSLVSAGNKRHAL